VFYLLEWDDGILEPPRIGNRGLTPNLRKREVPDNDRLREETNMGLASAQRLTGETSKGENR